LNDLLKRIHVHRGDLPAELDCGPVVAIDSETMGLNPARDRLCVVQLSTGDGAAHLVQIARDAAAPARLVSLLGNRTVLKIFHFARFDVGVFLKNFSVLTSPIYCTKTASRLVRTMSDRHGLKDLCKELLGVELSKQQQMSDWGSGALTDEQRIYAANDVLHLHALKAKLDDLIAREGRLELARACFEFIPQRATLDVAGWADTDIFAH
jgi:ribonuclease D